MGQLTKVGWRHRYFSFLHSGSQEPVAQLLKSFGLTRATFAEGEGYLKELNAADDEFIFAQKDTQGGQYKLDVVRRDAHAQLVEARALVRVLTLNDSVLQRQLHVTGRLPRSLGAWLHFAERFYASLVAHPDLWEQVQRALPRVAGQSSVAAVRKKVAELEAAQHAQRLAGQRYRQADKVMRTYYRRAAGLARLALRDHPPYRRNLGL